MRHFLSFLASAVMVDKIRGESSATHPAPGSLATFMAIDQRTAVSFYFSQRAPVILAVLLRFEQLPHVRRALLVHASLLWSAHSNLNVAVIL